MKKDTSGAVEEREISSDEESLLPSLEGPPHGPIGIHKQFISKTLTTLTIKDHIHKGSEDYSVSNQSGKEILFVRSSPASLTNRRHFLTPSGEELYVLRAEKFKFPQSWYLQPPSSEETNSESKEKLVRFKGHVAFFNLPHLDISFTNAFDGKEVTLKVRGKWTKRKGEIYNADDGVVLARVRQSFQNTRRLLLSQSSYELQVAPGVDAALMVACVVSVDAQVMGTA